VKREPFVGFAYAGSDALFEGPDVCGLYSMPENSVLFEGLLNSKKAESFQDFAFFIWGISG
jgi:hypothetical protein